MKIKLLTMFVFLFASAVILTGCGDNALSFLADDSSSTACQYEVAMDLDEGRYQEVLDASCASDMDRGAAYFGLAGYDVNDVIERMVDASDDTDENQIDTYLSSLVQDVDAETLDNLSTAKSLYNTVAVDTNYDDDVREDAQFYRDVMIGPIEGLSSIKTIIDPDGDGVINKDCDKNNNGTPDEVDATSCALLISADPVGRDCSSVGASEDAASPVNSLTFTGYTGTYAGLVINITDNGGTPACTTNQYLKLLATGNIVVATTSDPCPASGYDWKCPYEDANGTPADIVTVLSDALNSADDTLTTLLGGEESDISDSIDELILDACGGDTCTSAEISAYLQNIGM